MSKVLCIPDSHLKISVIEHGLKLAKKHRADTIVLLGDYFDDWESEDAKYLEMLDYLKKLLRFNPSVVPLLGEHELGYIGFPCPGKNTSVESQLHHALFTDQRFLFGVGIDGVFYSHAGVCVQWLKDNHLITQNDLRLKLVGRAGATLLENIFNKIERFDVFYEVGPKAGGKNAPSPVWAPLSDLIADAPPVKQVVGHTPVSQIEKIDKIWFTDVFSHDSDCDEYLFVVDGEPEVLHYNEEFEYE